MVRVLWIAFGAAVRLVVVAVVVVGLVAVGLRLLVSGTLSSDRSFRVPVAYRDLVTQYGSSCPQLTPARLAAQLQVESGYDPRAVSHVGAQGIAQFMPATWREHAVDGNGDGRKDPFDPRDAIPAAARYDCWLAGELKGITGDHIELMLAGYNAGPDRVRQHRGVPPYGETQAYVARVRDFERGGSAALTAA
jgi:soluble lytic murein transglycosylase-like protein